MTSDRDVLVELILDARARSAAANAFDPAVRFAIERTDGSLAGLLSDPIDACRHAGPGDVIHLVRSDDGVADGDFIVTAFDPDTDETIHAGPFANAADAERWCTSHIEMMLEPAAPEPVRCVVHRLAPVG